MEVPAQAASQVHSPESPPKLVVDRGTHSLGVESRAVLVPATRRGIPEFSELVLASRHHLKLTLMAGVLLSILLVSAAWWLTDAPYVAESFVRVKQHQDVVLTARTSRADDAIFVRAQAQVVLSPQVLAAALSDESVRRLGPFLPAHNAAAWLKDLLRVEVLSGAEVMSIAVSHTDPAVAQLLCNSVTRAYLTETEQRSTSERQRHKLELDRAAREADRQLDVLWAQLNEVAAKVGSDDSQSLTIRDELQLQAYRETTQQFHAAQRQGQELQSQRAAEQLKRSDNLIAGNESTQRLLAQHPEMLRTQETLARLEAQLEQMRAVVANDDSPRLQRLVEDRERIRIRLAQLTAELETQLIDTLKQQQQQQLESSLAELDQQIELNAAHTNVLRDRLTDIDAQVIRTDKKNGIQLDMARHAVNRQSRLADSVWQSLEEFMIEMQSEARVSPLEFAELPLQPNQVRRYKAAGGTLALSWLIVVLTIGFAEWQACRVRNGHDVLAHTVCPFYGVNALDRTAVSKHKSAAGGGAHELVAKLLLSATSGGHLPSVLVSSATTDEPNHLVALNLALSSALLGRRTLLIDCGTSGALSHKLLADKLPGMRDVKSQACDPRKFVLASTDAHLDYLPLGQGNSADSWVEPESLQYVLQSLNSSYQAMFISGPAIACPLESLLLAKQADYLALAVFCDLSRWDLLASSEQIALRSGIPMIGSVLHSGSAAGLREVCIELQDARPPTDTEDNIETSLRENLAGIQQDIQQAAERSAVTTKKAVFKNSEIF